jgi:4-amino-4-deoxy-L-arabinose transferase-like glycosyltransferase
MWLGAVGVAVQRLLRPAHSLAHLDWIRRLAWLAPENAEAFRHLAFFLPGGRVAVALVTTLGLSGAYLLLVRLLDRKLALLSLGLLVFDPFLVGHAGLLHTDALLAVFSLLTLLFALNGLHEPRRVVWWSLAGFSAGLSLLTKTPGGVLIPFVMGIAVWSVLRDLCSWKQVMMGLFFFLTGTALTVFVWYPALWVDATDVFHTTYSFAEELAEAAPRPIFFAGEMTLNPGPAFYPIVFLFRISPVVFIGISAGLASWCRLPSRYRTVLLTSLGFTLLFGAGISLGSKMHDRYLLPAFLPLASGAALGFDSWLDRYGDRWRGLAILQGGWVKVLMPVLFQAIIALAFAARPLSYSNPLLGGPGVASCILPTGWGERWGAAARWLNQSPEAESLTVAATSVPSFASLFDGHTVPFDGDGGNVALADYVVAPYDRSVDLPTYRTIDGSGCRRAVAIYTNTAPFEQAEYLADRVEAGVLILLDADTPLRRRYEGSGLLLSAVSLPDEATVADRLAAESAGRETIWLVASPAASPITAAHLRTQLGRMATQVSSATVDSATITRHELHDQQDAPPVLSYRAAFGGQLALVDGALPQAVAWPEELQIHLRWRALVLPSADYQATVVLRDGEGHTWATVEALIRSEVNFPASAWAPGEWSDAGYGLRLPPGIPPGPYVVEVSVYDSEGGARLGASDQRGSFQGTRVPVGEVIAAPPVETAGVSELGMGERLDVSAGSLTLIGMNPVPDRVLSGERFSLELFWQADAAPDADHRVRLRLDGPRDEAGLEFATPLSSYPTSRWRSGDRFRSKYGLRVSPDVPPGRYQLMLNTLDENGDPVWEQDRSLASLQVVPRERAFVLPKAIPDRLDVTFGEKIHLRGYALLRTEVARGQTLPLTLYWQADGPTDASYTLFVHLLAPDGQIDGQLDRIPGNGAAPTSSWSEGQVIIEEIALPVASDAAAGERRIAVGFYDAAYGERLSVVTGDRRMLPQNRVVLPTAVRVAP